jgi:hypothetical protein
MQGGRDLREMRGVLARGQSRGDDLVVGGGFHIAPEGGDEKPGERMEPIQYQYQPRKQEQDPVLGADMGKLVAENSLQSGALPACGRRGENNKVAKQPGGHGRGDRAIANRDAAMNREGASGTQQDAGAVAGGSASGQDLTQAGKPEGELKADESGSDEPEGSGQGRKQVRRRLASGCDSGQRTTYGGNGAGKLIDDALWCVRLRGGRSERGIRRETGHCQRWQ